MRWIRKWLKRCILVLLILIVLLLSPIVYVEVACRGDAPMTDYKPILPAEHHRSEAKTLLTYPEWHIVHAYDDYAKVIETGDPHDFGFVKSIAGFWSSLCALSRRAPAHGGAAWETKQTIYVIGVSFTAELLLKAAYEETIGRVFTLLRGNEHSPLDTVSARQAADYAKFLQQTPWYKWDFDSDVAALQKAKTDALRDWERRTALGIEFGAKSEYAAVIASAVESVGADELTLRMIVASIAADDLKSLPGVVVINERSEGIEIETPRYRALTQLIIEMAVMGAEFVEIAGNDDILLTMTSDEKFADGALYSFERLGYGDYRHLVVLKTTELAGKLRNMAEGQATLEHVHDY